MAQGTVKWFNAARAMVSSPPTTAPPTSSFTTPPSRLTVTAALQDNQRIQFTATQGPKGAAGGDVRPI